MICDRKLFPVQEKIIPIILNSNNSQSIYPNDLCVTAPTGSGKTLTFVLPIVESLRHRIKPGIRALVILPVGDLAEQVYNVFKENAVDSKLRVALLSTKTSFSKEQTMLIDPVFGEVLFDIVVTTPGRLVDHIQKTQGFNLAQLRFLVLDECDRIMDQIKQNWLDILLDKLNLKEQRWPLANNELNVFNLFLNKEKMVPMQKLLLSATLARDPEKLDKLALFQPNYHSVKPIVDDKKDTGLKASPKAHKSDKAQTENETKTEDSINEDKVEKKKERKKKQVAGDNRQSTEAISVPKELSELFIECTSFEKPLVMIYLMKKLEYKRVICFVKSIDTSKRLSKLLELNGIKAGEYSSSLHVERRKRILKKFETDKYDVLICSDLMARGMDISHVSYVVLYDMPKHVNSYIHRVGRTARAGQTGTAITLLEHKQVFFFKKMLTTTVEHSSKLKEIKVQKSKLKPLTEDFKLSLIKLKEALTGSKAQSKGKKGQKQAQNGNSNDGSIQNDEEPTTSATSTKKRPISDPNDKQTQSTGSGKGSAEENERKKLKKTNSITNNNKNSTYS